jgi:hypothetical protein
LDALDFSADFDLEVFEFGCFGEEIGIGTVGVLSAFFVGIF